MAESMIHGSEDHPSVQLHRDVSSIAEARSWLVSVLNERYRVPEEKIGVAAVLTSELVTNALEHTASEPVIAIEESGTRIVVAVHDEDPSEPIVRDLDPLRVGGNGLRIVDEWSDEWGVRRVPDRGKVVWFAIGR